MRFRTRYQFRESVIPQTDNEAPSFGLAVCPSPLLAPVKCRLPVARRLIKMISG